MQQSRLPCQQTQGLCQQQLFGPEPNQFAPASTSAGSANKIGAPGQGLRNFPQWGAIAGAPAQELSYTTHILGQTLVLFTFPSPMFFVFAFLQVLDDCHFLVVDVALVVPTLAQQHTQRHNDETHWVRLRLTHNLHNVH